MARVKRALKRTPLYAFLERWRAHRFGRRWSLDDEARAAFYAQFIRPGDLVFDVGANIGNRTKIFLRLGARVVAVEPIEECASFLERAFASFTGLTVLRKALGSSEGRAALMISSATTISTLSRPWAEAVRRSGRFADYSWEESRAVPVATVDGLIDRYGLPSFIKIDVEGYELEVLQGLSRPVPALSFEFVPEYFDSAVACLERLRSIGDIRVNWVTNEETKFAMERFVTSDELLRILSESRDRIDVFGDIYCEFVGDSSGT